MVLVAVGERHEGLQKILPGNEVAGCQTIQAVICNNSVKCKYNFNVEKQF